MSETVFFQIVVPIVFGIFFIVVLFTLFSKKARQKFLSITIGSKIVKDFGEFSDADFMGFNQKLSLQEHEKNGQRFFLIESNSTSKLGLAKNIQWFKLTDEALTKLSDMIQKAKG